MGKDAVYDWLRQSIELTIAFDTNVLFGDKSLTVLCNKINHLGRPIKLVVPAPAYLEKLHDLKQRHKHDYDFKKFFMDWKTRVLR